MAPWLSSSCPPSPQTMCSCCCSGRSRQTSWTTPWSSCSWIRRRWGSKRCWGTPSGWTSSLGAWTTRAVGSQRSQRPGNSKKALCCFIFVSRKSSVVYSPGVPGMRGKGSNRRRRRWLWPPTCGWPECTKETKEKSHMRRSRMVDHRRKYWAKGIRLAFLSLLLWAGEPRRLLEL